MNHIVGENREQLILFSETMDDIINEENPVRFIDAFIEKLDLRKLKFKIRKTDKGRPSYSEKLLLKIYIYGYLNKIRSSRKLEKECLRNIELIWLTGRLAPDFKTIADFRKDNKKGIKSVFKEFIKLCHKAGLISFDIVGIDGTKVSAQNHNSNVYHRKNIDKINKKIDEKIEAYLKELENNDGNEKNDFEFLSRNIEKKIKKLKTRKEKVKVIEKIFEENPELESYYATDPESRFMNDKGKSDVAYNMQASVDSKHKLIVDMDITNENNDVKQMKRMCDRVEGVKEELKVEKNTAKVSDAGYYSDSQVLECVDGGHDVYMPTPEDEHRKRKNGKHIRIGIIEEGYHIENFKYDKEKDVYICPEGQILRRYGNARIRNHKEIYRYKCNSCDKCTARNKCTKSKSGRTIEIPLRKEDIDRFKQTVRSENGKKMIRLRKEICEHPFGTIKRNFGYTYFLMRGMESAQAESSLFGLVYNMRRAFTILGTKELMKLI